MHDKKKYRPDTQNMSFDDTKEAIITAATVTTAMVVVALAFVYLPAAAACVILAVIVIALVLLFVPLNMVQQKPKPRVYSIPGNRAQLRQMAPTSIDIGTDAMKVNEQTIRVFNIENYPPEVYDGWLSDIISSRENITMSIHIYPSDTDYVKAQLDMEIGKIDSTILGLGKTDPKVEPLKHYSGQLKDYRERLIAGQTKPFLAEVLLSPKAKKRRHLDDTTKELMRRFRGRGAALSAPYLRQDKALTTLHPNGINYLGKYHSFDSYSLKTIFPFSRATFGTDEGTLYGYTPGGDPIIFSRFKMRTPHMCTAGATRSGKSFQLKYNTWRAYLYHPDMRVFIVDPTPLPKELGLDMSEYALLTTNIGGQIIKMGAGGKDVINPFDIRTVPTMSNTPVTDKIQRVMGFFNTILNLTQHEAAVLEAVLPGAYAAVGVTEGTKAAEYMGKSPTFSHIEDALRGFRKQDDVSHQDREISDKLARIIQPWTKTNLNAQTNVDIKKRWIMFDVSGVRGTPNFAPVAYIVTDFIYAQCVQTTKPKNIIFDECHLMMDNEILRKQVAIFAREMGKYNAALTVASQSVEDFLKYDEGRTIVGNCPIVTLMRHESIGKAMQEYWNFTPAEQTLIRRAATGREGYSEGLVIAENSRAHVLFTADPHEHKYITTKPEELQEIARRMKG